MAGGACRRTATQSLQLASWPACMSCGRLRWTSVIVPSGRGQALACCANDDDPDERAKDREEQPRRSSQQSYLDHAPPPLLDLDP